MKVYTISICIWTETIQKIFYCKKHKNRNTIFDVLEMDVLVNILLTFETHIAAEKKKKKKSME